MIVTKRFYFALLIIQLSFFSVAHSVLPAANNNSPSGSATTSVAMMPDKTLDLGELVKEKAYLKIIEQDIIPYIKQKQLRAPSCFISYAWGNPEHEFWVRRLAEMLTKSGIKVLLDRWEDRKGKVLNSFVNKIEEVDWVIVVGTKRYLQKYKKRAENLQHREHVVRLEAQLIEYLISYSTERGDKVIPLLLEGTAEESLPFMLRHKLPSDFTQGEYFEELLKLIHDMFGVDNQDNNFEHFFKEFKKYSAIIATTVTEQERLEYIETQKKHLEEDERNVIQDVKKLTKEALHKIAETSHYISSHTRPVASETEDNLFLNLQPRNLLFTGRTKELLTLKSNFNNKNKFNIVQQTIFGLAGVGKSQLAMEFAHLAIENRWYDSIVWIDAESAISINNSYRKIAKKICKNITGLGVIDIEKLIHKKLLKPNNNLRMLFILDYAPDHAAIAGYLKRLCDQWSIGPTLHILITSRSQNWPNFNLMLDDFSKEEARNFVKEQLPQESEINIDHLTSTLDYFPLALTNAVSYIKEYTNISDYLEIYKSNSSKCLNSSNGNINQCHNTLWKTWNIALSKLSNTAQDILYISSYLNSNDIPLELFHQIPIDNRTSAIGELRKHSFITLVNGNEHFKIHRLLQEVIRKHLSIKNNIKYLETGIELMNNAFTFDRYYCDNCGNSIKLTHSHRKYLPHIHSLQNHAFAYSDKQFQLLNDLLLRLGAYYLYYSCEYDKAGELFIILLNRVKDPITIARIKNHLSWVKFVQKDFNYSKQLCYEVREALKDTTDPDLIVDLVSSYRITGNIESQLKNFEAAQKDYDTGMQIQKQFYKTDDHPVIAHILHNVAHLSLWQGKTEEAIQTFLASIAAEKNYYKLSSYPMTLNTAETFYDLAKVTCSLTRYNEAKAYIMQAIEFHQNLYGDQHPKTQRVFLVYGDILFADGKYNDALKVYSDTLEKYQLVNNAKLKATIMEKIENCQLKL